LGVKFELTHVNTPSSQETPSHQGGTLASFLCFVLDQLGTTRSEWATFLGVTSQALSQWVNGKSAPRADTLAAILRRLDENGSQNVRHAVLAFESIADGPSDDVAPTLRGVSSLREYILPPEMLRFQETLNLLSAKDRIAWLRGAILTLRDRSQSSRPEFPETAILKPESIRYLLSTMKMESPEAIESVLKDAAAQVSTRPVRHPEILTKVQQSQPTTSPRQISEVIVRMAFDNPEKVEIYKSGTRISASDAQSKLSFSMSPKQAVRAGWDWTGLTYVRAP
jgi:transcriptional regulator with XRE-family HTH domain